MAQQQSRVSKSAPARKSGGFRARYPRLMRWLYVSVTGVVVYTMLYHL